MGTYAVVLYHMCGSHVVYWIPSSGGARCKQEAMLSPRDAAGGGGTIIRRLGKLCCWQLALTPSAIIVAVANHVRGVGPAVGSRSRIYEWELLAACGMLCVQVYRRVFMRAICCQS